MGEVVTPSPAQHNKPPSFDPHPSNLHQRYPTSYSLAFYSPRPSTIQLDRFGLVLNLLEANHLSQDTQTARMPSIAEAAILPMGNKRKRKEDSSGGLDLHVKMSRYGSFSYTY